MILSTTAMILALATEYGPVSGKIVGPFNAILLTCVITFFIDQYHFSGYVLVHVLAMNRSIDVCICRKIQMFSRLLLSFQIIFAVITWIIVFVSVDEEWVVGPILVALDFLITIFSIITLGWWMHVRKTNTVIVPDSSSTSIQIVST
jgi:hypothetical protein